MLKTKTPVTDIIDITVIEADLRPQSTEKLKFRFFECYNGAARFIAEAAVCVKLLKERGDTLTGLPMVGTFLRIASGQISADLFWTFLESPNRRFVERLPLEDQKRLAANPMVPVVEAKPDGGFTTRMIDLTKAPAETVKLALGDDGVRSPEEQISHLCMQKAKPPVVRASAEEIDRDEPLNHQIAVKLTDSELEAVKIQAAVARLSEGQLVRRMLIQAGAFKRPKNL